MSGNQSKNKEQSDKRHAVRSLSGILLRGHLLDGEFFAKNWLVIAVMVVLALAYITNKYSCQTLMEEEKRLSERLEIVKTERVRMRSIYMGRIRESSMQHLADSMHLGLSIQERPPFRLSLSK
ncbi:MAG: FtsL-like putative cell division protein [Muribaculaceae bacterium]|nr:FtsL-like putative cell division protein [Muribaculaceae bacterium]